MTPKQLDAISDAQCLRAAAKMGLVKNIDASGSDRLALLCAIESLQAELEAAKADQARYLFLRDTIGVARLEEIAYAMKEKK